MNRTPQVSRAPRWPGRLLALLLLLGAWHSCLAAQCPKLLMFDGTDPKQQTTPIQAEYWGNTVGVQGFFVNRLMPDWQFDVGADPDGTLWQIARRFQTLYSRYGVTDNFVKVAAYRPHDWRDPAQNQLVTMHFAHAAALARYAGFKGVALDIEPYVPTWGGAAGDISLAATVQAEGRAIGNAMHTAYPGMTLVIIKDALHEAFPHAQLAAIGDKLAQPLTMPKRAWHGGYTLSVPFLRGLLSVHWSSVVIATEDTYKRSDIANVVHHTQTNYVNFMGDGVAEANVSVAPGLWPLGHSYSDKSARRSPAIFEQDLEAAFSSASRYVWIYGYGSAWQTNGSYGSGAVAPDFHHYLDAIRAVKMQCRALGLRQPPHSSERTPHVQAYPFRQY